MTKISTPRLQKGAAIDLTQLDALLDVPVAQWERGVKRLLRESRTRQFRFDLPATLRGADGFESTDVSWTTLFDAQIRHLPRMDRAEEFRMARRYDFMKARVRDALARAGHRESVLDELVLRPMHTLPAPTRKTTPADTAYLAVCIDDLRCLRNLYVEGSLYIVHGPVRRYTGLGVDEIDLVQEACASLFQAIEGFDWRREVRFKTYAVYWVQQAILKTLYNASRTVRIPIWVQKAHRKIRRALEGGQHLVAGVPDYASLSKELDMPVERIEEILAVRRFAVSLDAQISGAEDGFSLAGALPDDSAEPVHETIQEGDLNVELQAVLEELPERERAILERRYGLNGQEPETLADIADDYGVTAERIRQLQKAALERLQKPRPMDRLKLFA